MSETPTLETKRLRDLANAWQLAGRAPALLRGSAEKDALAAIRNAIVAKDAFVRALSEASPSAVADALTGASELSDEERAAVVNCLEKALWDAGPNALWTSARQKLLREKPAPCCTDERCTHITGVALSSSTPTPEDR